MYRLVVHWGFGQSGAVHTITPGTWVDWILDVDTFNHTVVQIPVSSSPNAVSSPILQPGSKFSFRFDSQGDFYLQDTLNPTKLNQKIRVSLGSSSTPDSSPNSSPTTRTTTTKPTSTTATRTTTTQTTTTQTRTVGKIGQMWPPTVSELTISVGDTIEWGIFVDRPYEIQCLNPQFDSGILILGDVFAYTFTVPGTAVMSDVFNSSAMQTVFVVGAPRRRRSADPSSNKPEVRNFVINSESNRNVASTSSTSFPAMSALLAFGFVATIFGVVLARRHNRQHNSLA